MKLIPLHARELCLEPESEAEHCQLIVASQQLKELGAMVFTGQGTPETLLISLRRDLKLPQEYDEHFMFSGRELRELCQALLDAQDALQIYLSDEEIREEEMPMEKRQKLIASWKERLDIPEGAPFLDPLNVPSKDA